MRTLRLILLFLVIFCSVSWSVRAQSDPAQSSASEVIWLALGADSPDDPSARTTLPLPARRAATDASFVLHHQADAVLLHLKNERNYVALQVMSATGQVIQATTHTNLSGGFHELTLLNSPTEPTFYVLRLIINQEVIAFSATL